MFKKPQRGHGCSEWKKKKKTPVKKVVGEEITTHQNILQGAKCLKKLLWESIRPLVLSTRERNRQRFTPLIWDFLLPQLNFILFSEILLPPWTSKKKEKAGLESWSEEMRRWRWGPSLPQNWDLTLKRHRPPRSIFHRCLPAASLSAPHPPHPTP